MGPAMYLSYSRIDGYGAPSPSGAPIGRNVLAGSGFGPRYRTRASVSLRSGCSSVSGIPAPPSVFSISLRSPRGPSGVPPTWLWMRLRRIVAVSNDSVRTTSGSGWGATGARVAEALRIVRVPLGDLREHFLPEGGERD